MRILHINTAYPEYLALYYGRHAQRASLPFAEQEALYYADAFAWAGFWSAAVARLGHEMWDITLNMEPLQRTWARERGLPGAPGITLAEIALQQVRAYAPDVLFYNHYDARLLAAIREQVPSVRLVMGWSGSPDVHLHDFSAYDYVLSCAPEAVDLLRQKGVEADHLDHGFSPVILDALHTSPEPSQAEVFFAGQVLLGSPFHQRRHALLAALHRRGTRLRVYSDSFRKKSSATKRLREHLRYATYHTVGRMVSPPSLDRFPKIAAYRGGRRPADALGIPEYSSRVVPAVYGMDMYRAVARAQVALNVHADSSPRYASNMRLFEITGAGSCLLTDSKENLATLFEPDREVVAYDGPDDCAEKAAWLLDHPDRCAEIARAGQARTLRDHTFDARAPELLHLIRKHIP